MRAFQPFALHIIIPCICIICILPIVCHAFSAHNNPKSSNLKPFNKCTDRRTSFKSIFETLSITSTITTAATTLLLPSPSQAATDEGISVITDSSLGQSIRKSTIQGARVIDRLDESWERFSDGLRDVNKCDVNTGRRLYDNGFRKDGTRVGDPILGALCNPQPLLPLDAVLADRVLNLATQSALVTIGNTGDDARLQLQRIVQETRDLVKPSFERTMKLETNPEAQKRVEFNFQVYSTMRAIQVFLLGSGLNNNNNNNNANAKLIRMFQLNWGQAMVSDLAPNANRKDYVSPFPEVKDEFEDYDYDKNVLLDALGALTVSLNKLKEGGIIGYFEISIPYDDYGSVVTVAIDDYTPIGAEILLSEQSYSIAGPGQALVRHVLDKAKIDHGLDSFYIDPSTTKQSVYNPNQLLLSLSNLRKR